jgi:hypothetical protein
VVLVGIYIILAVVPFTVGYTPMTLASGYLYRIWIGTATSCVGAFIGTTLAFLCMRYLFYDWAMQQIEKRKKLRIVMNAVRHHAFKVILMMRLTPVPFGFQNAIYAVSGWLWLLSLLPPIEIVLMPIHHPHRCFSDSIHGRFKHWFISGYLIVKLCRFSSSRID